MKERHHLAARVRVKRLEELTEIYDVCRCEWPLVRYRNGHGHGKTTEGEECPAVAVILSHAKRREEQRALANLGLDAEDVL